MLHISGLSIGKEKHEKIYMDNNMDFRINSSFELDLVKIIHRYSVVIISVTGTPKIIERCKKLLYGYTVLDARLANSDSGWFCRNLD